MWKLDGTDGSLEIAGTVTRVDVAHPEQGFLSSASNGRFMQLLPNETAAVKSLKLAEAYVRGNDLSPCMNPSRLTRSSRPFIGGPARTKGGRQWGWR